MKLTKTQTQFDLPPFGVYTLSFRGLISVREFENKENPEGPPDVSMNLRFEIEDEGDWKGTEIRAFYPEKLTDGNKTGKLFAAIFGNEGVPDEFELNDLIGRRFRALIKDNGKGWPAIESPTALVPTQGKAARSAQPPSDAVGYMNAANAAGLDLVPEDVPF